MFCSGSPTCCLALESCYSCYYCYYDDDGYYFYSCCCYDAHADADVGDDN